MNIEEHHQYIMDQLNKLYPNVFVKYNYNYEIQESDDMGRKNKIGVLEVEIKTKYGPTLLYKGMWSGDYIPENLDDHNFNQDEQQLLLDALQLNIVPRFIEKLKIEIWKGFIHKYMDEKKSGSPVYT